ncbi:hypothetical protein Tco_1458938 [Tanacetum coccineum]
MEHILGEAYINDNLKTLKPYHITALSFKPTIENETALTTHICKVAELSLDPIKTLLHPSREVNADDAADKSSSRTSVQPVIQSKAPTDLKPKKKIITPSSKPKSSKQVRDEPQKKQVAETQPAEGTVVTANATQSLGASESAEDQVNQPQTANAEKNKMLKWSSAIEESKRPYDTEFKIKIIKRFQPNQMDDEDQIIFLGAKYDDMDHHVEEPADSDLHSIPDDQMVLISGFGTDDSNIKGTEYTEPKLSDPLGHLRKEISSLTTQVQQLESSITQKVADKPEIINESLKVTLPDLISESLKLAIPETITDSVKQTVKPINR